MGFSEEDAKRMQERVNANRATRPATPMLDRALNQLSESELIRMMKDGTPIVLNSTMPPAVAITLDIDPIGAPRQTRRDAWEPCTAVVRYRAWKDKFRPACEAAGWQLTPDFRVEFDVAMPPSWSKKKKSKMLGAPHQQRPDIDNMCKAIMDAFGKDDGYVHTLNAIKRWAKAGRITLYK